MRSLASGNMAGMDKIRIKKAPNAGGGDNYWFTIERSNGEIVAVSEMYTRKASAKSGIRSVAFIFAALFRTSHSGAALAVDDLFTLGKSGDVAFVDETGE